MGDDVWSPPHTARWLYFIGISTGVDNDDKGDAILNANLSIPLAPAYPAVQQLNVCDDDGGCTRLQSSAEGRTDFSRKTPGVWGE